MLENLTPAVEALAKFKAYYLAVWPALIVIHLLALVVFYVLIKQKQSASRIISLIIAFLWLWDGIVHQMILAAYPPEHWIPMTILFVLQGLLFFYHGVIRSNLVFDFKLDEWTSRLGLFYMIYAFIGYLIFGFLLGHPFTQGGVFFSNICAFDCFTLGLLMMSGRKTPLYLIFIPLLWALVGGLLAMFAWKIWDDFGLVSAGILATAIMIAGKVNSRKASLEKAGML